VRDNIKDTLGAKVLHSALHIDASFQHAYEIVSAGENEINVMCNKDLKPIEFVSNGSA
jgi:hypothetical protein